MYETTSQPSRVGADFQVEVFDWNQIEQAKSLGTAKIELADIEPFEAAERIVSLSHAKHGDKGHIRVRFMFQPEIIARTRTKTSTFSSAGRAVTQIGGLPLAGGEKVFHGVGRVGGGIGKVFKRDHAKAQESISSAEDAPAGQSSVPVAPDSSSLHGSAVFPSTPGNGRGSPTQDAGTLRVTVLDAKDLSDNDAKPYVTIRVGDKEYKTKHIKGAAPQWCVSLRG